MIDTVSILAIAFGLSLDAFAVSVLASLTLKTLTRRHLFRLSFHFGLFQAVMLVLGWAAGRSIEATIGDWDHWVAFAVLCVIGLRAVRSAMDGRAGPAEASDPTRGLTLVGLSVATSIDALAVGLTFGVLGMDILVPVIVIGVVAAAMTFCGMLLGRRLGLVFGRRAELAGGLVLIAIAVKVLAEHLAQ